ncbi:very short patch repair endonuclease, partial [Pseudomonas syringae]
HKGMPGKPDLVFSRLKICIFVHGCFWHQHPNCKYAYIPKTRIDFWTDKFSKNRIRDLKVQNEILTAGWSVAVVWECELRNREALVERLSKLLNCSDPHSNCDP